MVADVEKYPEFVPFCVTCVILSTETPDQAEIEWKQSNPEGKLVFAETSVGFKLFKETYVSRIKLIPQKSIEVLQSLRLHCSFSRFILRIPTCSLCFTPNGNFMKSSETQMPASFIFQWSLNSNRSCMPVSQTTSSSM